jgi:ubiquinol-cytochrome c reductase cytochrome b subunit
MNRMRQWLYDRTGVDRLARAMLHERIAGGARWRYVFGSALVFLFVVQALTGVLLMTVYSPSATTAWSSVWYIQTQMTLGWLVRGVHHYSAQAFVVVAAVHVVQVVLAKAYRPPREFNWWLGMALLGVVLGAGLTGYLLPWDQRGYWATKVATNILGLTPVIGEWLQRVVIGGDEYGHLTLTRFHALHVAVLPMIFVLLTAAHVALFRRHGVTVEPRLAARGEGWFWPKQALYDGAACAVVLAIVAALASYSHAVRGDMLLDAPADPAASDYPARPEWYFLFLFQMLKYFEGPTLEVVGAMVIPAAVTLIAASFPFVHRLLPGRAAHRLVATTMFALIGGVWWLTWGALRDDRAPDAALVAAIEARQARGESLTSADAAALRARRFQEQRAAAAVIAERAFALAATQGIPPEGPLGLLRGDPVLQGPRLFAAHCAACHRFDGHDGTGRTPPEPATAADLAGFGTAGWIRGFLAEPQANRYFGLITRPDGRPGHTRMSRLLERLREENAAEADAERLEGDLDAVAAYLAGEAAAPGKPGATADAQVLRGRSVFETVCNECHAYQGERTGTTLAPEMYGYGSAAWIAAMIRDPAHDTLYRSAGREPAIMPSFGGRLNDQEIELIAAWLRMPREADDP